MCAIKIKGFFKKLFEEKNIHLIFQISLIIRGIFSVLEILSGIFIYFISKDSIVRTIKNFAKKDLLKNHHDVIVAHLNHWADTFSISTRLFITIYLIVHGVIRLWLIIGLLKKKLWYYPLSLVVFILFVVYQFYRYSFTHSLFLLFITVIDILVIWLTWHEYQFLRRESKRK